MPDYFYVIRLILLIGIALAYALFDLFNRREVPNLFAYAALAVAIALSVSYPVTELLIGAAVALLVAGLGYLLYSRGLLGAGDVLELVTIALLLPLQPAPLLAHVPQLSMPFVLSVFISAGYSAVIVLVLYYMLFARKSPLEKNFHVKKERVLTGIILVTAYALLAVMMYALAGIGVIGIAVIMALAIFSGMMFVFERLMNYRMVSMLLPKELTTDDMIATNLMSRSDLAYFRRKSRNFGRLATTRLMRDLKSERRKIPVYRNAAPLAAFFFIGVVFSLLFGNLIFLVI